MNRLGHLLVAFIVGLIYLFIANRFWGWYPLTIFNMSFWGIYMIIIFIYALLPDIDHKMSSITWLFLGLGAMGMIAAFVLNDKIIMGVSLGLIIMTYIAAQYFPHRGPTHTIWFGALAATPLYFLLGIQSAVLGFIIYYSHLAADGEFFKIDF